MAPYSPATGLRSSLIATVVAAAVPGVTVSAQATGGTATAGLTWERDRGQFISDIARDGSLDAAFDGAGVFVVRTEPIIEPTTAIVATFKSGPSANIITATRERPFDRLYNTVVVIPVDETQTWPRQVVTLSDPNHPRYSGKIGVVPYFYASPTLSTASAAMSAAITILQRVLGTTETVRLGAIGSPALEVGDAVVVVKSATQTDPGFSAIHLIDGYTLDLVSGAMELDTRSSSIAEVEESA